MFQADGSNTTSLSKLQFAPSLTMSSREIAELCGKRHDNVMRVCRDLAETSVFQGSPQSEEAPYIDQQNNQTYNHFVLNKRDSFVVVARLSPEFTARLVDRWQELEAERAQPRVALPDFADPIAAARAWADQYEARLFAERTKAEIGGRREATAMNTASQAVKKASKLEIELDKSKQYASVKRMQMLYHGQEFSWRVLKHVSAEMGIPPVDIFDANYGTVKAYHADVWKEAYALAITNGQG